MPAKLGCQVPLTSGGNKVENWWRFQEDLTIYLASTEKEGNPDAVKSTFMVSCAGRELVDIFDTLKFDAEVDEKKYLHEGCGETKLIF